MKQNVSFIVVLFLILKCSPIASLCEEGAQKLGLDEIENHFTDLLQGLDLALDVFNDEKGAVFKFVFLPATIDATRTVTDGNKFCVRVQIAPSSCRNTVENLSKRIDKCPVNFSDQSVVGQAMWCDIKILSRPWLNNIQIQKRICQHM